MSEIVLSCNAYNCDKRLYKDAYVTTCSHIFCKQHGVTIFDKSEICRSCLACGTKLMDPQYDLIYINLKPSIKYKATLLCGLNPEQIMDIASQAISFFSYQLNFENQSKETMIKEIKRQNEENCISISSSYQSELMKRQRFIDSLKRELEDKLREIEYQKQKLVNSMRENKHLQNKLENYKREIIFQRARHSNSHEFVLELPSLEESMSITEENGNPFKSVHHNKRNDYSPNFKY